MAAVASAAASAAVLRIQRDLRDYAAHFPLRMQQDSHGQQFGVEAAHREQNIMFFDVVVSKSCTLCYTRVFTW